MTALILEPHPDDAALFCAYQCCRTSGLIVTVLDCGEKRAEEAQWSARHLGCQTLQWANPQNRPDWQRVVETMAGYRDRDEYDTVFVPAWEETGHDHHNRVAECAAEVWDARMLRPYLTYTRANGRSEHGVKVEPHPDWVIAKLRALAMFESQIQDPVTRPWFMRGLDEWLAPS